MPLRDSPSKRSIHVNTHTHNKTKYIYGYYWLGHITFHSSLFLLSNHDDISILLITQGQPTEKDRDQAEQAMQATKRDFKGINSWVLGPLNSYLFL